MVTKAATLQLDAAIFDLEDAVPVADKETARIFTHDFIGLIKRQGIQTVVRVNSLATGLTFEDLKSTVISDLDAVMLAKTETCSNVVEIGKMLFEVEETSGLNPNTIGLIPLIETAKGVVNSAEISSASNRVCAIAFGAGDYYRDLGRDVGSISKDETELLYARSQIVNTSRAVGIQAIDTPFLGLLTENEGFNRDVDIAVRLGFKGKQCIHPSQVEQVNRAFSPSKSEIERATRIAKAYEDAQAAGLGAISFEGRMIDHMNYRQMKDTIAIAQAIETKEETFSKQTPKVGIYEIFSSKE